MISIGSAHDYGRNPSLEIIKLISRERDKRGDGSKDLVLTKPLRPVLMTIFKIRDGLQHL